MAAEERRDFRGSFSGYERDRVFYNPDGPGARFVSAAYVFGLDADHDGRAAAPVDIDGDGDLDLALLTLQGLRLYENTTAPQHFARVRLRATRTEPQAVGAIVRLTADGVTHQDFVKLTEGFQTQVPLDIHVGLGTSSSIDELEVEWPSGDTDVWRDLPVDRLLTVREGAATVAVGSLPRWPESTRPDVIGRPSPSVEAQELDGAVSPVAGGRPAVLNFWAPWCAPCSVELPQLVRLAERYAGEVDFVGMSVELDDLASVRQAIEDFAIPYPQFLADATVMQQFFGEQDAAALPSTYVFDAGGQLRRLFRGAITESDVDTLLQSFRDEGVFEADISLLARTAFRDGDYERAHEYYRRLSEIQPDSPEPLYQMGVAALRLGRMEDALAALDRAVTAAPTNALARFALGTAQFQSGRVQEGLTSFQTAVAFAGENPVVLRQLGNAAANSGQLWLAIDALERAVTADPGSAPTLIDMARAYRARGDLARARESYMRALSLEPTNEMVRQELAALMPQP